MTNEERAANTVATWVTGCREALGLSRLEFGALLAKVGVPKSAAWRFDTRGSVDQAELDAVVRIMRGALANLEQRVETAKKLLADGAIPEPTIVVTEKAPATAAAKAVPKTQRAIAATAAPAKPLAKMTINELKAHAHDLGLSAATKLSKKEDLVAAITEATKPARKATAKAAPKAGASS